MRHAQMPKKKHSKVALLPDYLCASIPEDPPGPLGVHPHVLMKLAHLAKHYGTGEVVFDHGNLLRSAERLAREFVDGFDGERTNWGKGRRKGTGEIHPSKVFSIVWEARQKHCAKCKKNLR